MSLMFTLDLRNSSLKENLDVREGASLRDSSSAGKRTQGKGSPG